MEKRRRFMVTIDAGDYLWGLYVISFLACGLLFFGLRWLLTHFIGHTDTTDFILVGIVLIGFIQFLRKRNVTI